MYLTSGGLESFYGIPLTPHYAHCVRSYGATFFRSPVPVELLPQTVGSMTFVYATCSMTITRRFQQTRRMGTN